MEDDDDARSGSQSSSESQTDSQSPPPSPTHASVSIAVSSGSGHHHPGDAARIAEPVTVAASPQRALAIALPVQQPRSSGKDAGGGSGGREDCWSEGATSTLIDAWGERYMELSRGNLKQKHWQEVADAVTSRDGYTKPAKTDVQCKNRIDTLKKKYKVEKNKISTSGASSWPFFHRLDHLLGPNHKPSPVPTPQPPPPPSQQPNNHQKILAGVPIRTPATQMRSQFPQRQRTSSHPAFKKMRTSPPPPPSASSKSEDGASSADSSDGLPPLPLSVVANGKMHQQKKKKKKKKKKPQQHPPPPPPPRRRATQEVDERRMAGLRELTDAILRFGEVYEKVESSKLQQATEMEKRRMEFATELEAQRMQFFMKTQLEVSQLKSSSPRRGGSRKRRRLGDVGGSSNHNNGNNNNNSNNSDNHG